MEFTEAMLAAYLAQAYLKQPKTAKDTRVGKGVIRKQPVSYALSSMQGWRSTMEDAHVVQVGLTGCPDVGVFGVFDGHGGDLAAIFVEHNLIAYLENSGHYSDMLQAGGECVLSGGRVILPSRI
jgi:protein phosphatase 1G